jgi:holo-[acyl-carrier protein] synthase
MILGIGCDICDINRIEKLISQNGEKFLSRVYLKSERERLQIRTPVAQGFAKVYAAKEALIKALGDSAGISWQHIEVIKNSQGRPEYILHKAAHATAQRLSGGKYQLHLSLSDEFPYAMAYAIFCN